MTAIISLVGRTNVGKSTLFNRLTGRKKALVHDRPGVTRDRREGDAVLFGCPFTVVDTAGLENGGELADSMWRQTQKALQASEAIVFIVDVRAGVTPLDKKTAQTLRKVGKPVILAANKAEGRDFALQDLYSLGFGDPVLISAEHGLGMSDLFEALSPYIKSETAEEEQPEEKRKRVRKKEEEIDLTDETEEQEDLTDRVIDLAIVGRPNVGKSTLVNRLLGEDRMLTGPMAGLTRDAISIDWTYKGRKMRLTDTAGLRRRSRVEDDLEKLSAADTKRAAFLAQVVVLVLDADAILDKQDLTIARQVLDEGRALIIAVNKWDTVKDKKQAMQTLNDRISTSLTQVKGLRTVAVSARTGEGLEQLMRAVFDVYAVWNSRISTGRLNRWLTKMTEQTPPPLSATKRPIPLKYMTQAKTRPPTFALFSSNPEKLPESYLRYLIKGLAQDLKIEGVPIRIIMRKAKNPYENKKRVSHKSNKKHGK
ncbi:MAG: ribosome biogenesis GTPase Der [Alphaproteobacteria bacterium]|nr:ribosome biogenesis GTPase Der [Alphaproteobacteria bacterium]MBO4644818.1 ribosome biogenesis GTPase Der [Alphaproteobacteria bacterium]